MKTVSICELHIHTSELVREAADGTVILIERCGEPVAELRPILKNPFKPWLPDLSDLWGRLPPVGRDSGHFLEEDR